ncbi:hypothetical protein AMAG_19772 [Allomyces macrogynus ATCC 38327]|uniref:BTB domain-containing protein n=1 Tax=Allomyces macrogynus (strain ATCC 38327) TaxID=578462 RepID=A0A0L0T230_ALLM3|nr:hypothetical protein AMAG_19772 [Allomyces macrogynus ATCC 38327]|eukprot:KNE68680.1 hypothetical protein AMAG_19772 [Allomyces macrogynus ATCC 38327]
MRLLQRAQSLYFELAYSLTAENHLLDRLEAFASVLEFFQVAAFIFSPHYTAWNATDFQNGLQIALLSLDQVGFDYAYEVAILAMLLAFISLVVQISRKGGITQFRILQLARFLVGVLGSFMFMPIVENGIHATYAYFVDGDTTRTLTMLLVLDTTIVVGLLVPTFAMAYLQGPDYHRLTAFSHPSSRQHVLLLGSKNFEISVFRQQGEDTRRLDVLDIIRYHYNYTEAMKHYLAVLKWSRQFWKVCSQDRVAVDALGFIADQMQDHQTAALHHYRALLERFPSSVAILRSYAAFIMDCVNNEQLGEEILEFAERLEEDRVTSVAPVPAVRAPVSKAAAAAAPEAVGTVGADDARSEHSASRYSSAKSSDVMSSINAQSIFDVASLDEQRNHVAMATLTAMRTAIRYSLIVLVVLGMLLYPLGTGFVSTVASSSQTIFDSGTLRRYMNAGAQALRNLHLGALSTTNATTIAALQAPVLTAAKTVYTSLNTVFYQTTQALDDQLVQYLTTGTTLTDKAFASIATKLSPLSFMEFFYLALYWGGLIAPTTVATDTNVVWGVVNSQPNSFFDLIQGVVSAYQSNYESNVRLRANALQIAALLATLVPLLVFILFFIPKWLRLRRELEATTSLFGRIPRKVAGILAADMKERIQSKLESEGMIDVGGARAAGGRLGSTGAGGGGESDHDLDERAGTSGKESHAHQTLAMRVLLVYLGAFILALVVVITFTMCLVQPIWMMFERGSLVNYSGMRLSIVLRIQYETLELTRLPAGDPMQDVWKAALTDHLALLGSVHSSVLYGNSALGLPRTVGLVPGADAATFAPSCSLGIPCLSLDEAITFLTTRVRLIMQNPSGATWLDLAQIAEIARLDGNFASRSTVVRTAFMNMNQNTINAYQTAATAIFASMFPLSLIVTYFLVMTARTVRDRIRRTRNILFQLPTDTIQSVPAIRDYLYHGTIEAALPSSRSSSSKDAKLAVAPSPAAIDDAGSGNAPGRASAEFVKYERPVWFSSRHSTWGEESLLTLPEVAASYVKDDVLIVGCRFAILSNVHDPPVLPTSPLPDLFQSETFSDVTVLVHWHSHDTPTAFHVHRLVLASQSTYFATLLYSPHFAEAHQPTVTLAHTDPLAFQRLLAFLYGRADTTRATLDDLEVCLATADRFGTDHWKPALMRDARQWIADATVWRVWALAVAYGSGVTAGQCAAYVAAHFARLARLVMASETVVVPRTVEVASPPPVVTADDDAMQDLTPAAQSVVPEPVANEAAAVSAPTVVARRRARTLTQDGGAGGVPHVQHHVAVQHQTEPGVLGDISVDLMRAVLHADALNTDGEEQVFEFVAAWTKYHFGDVPTPAAGENTVLAAAAEADNACTDVGRDEHDMDPPFVDAVTITTGALALDSSSARCASAASTIAPSMVTATAAADDAAAAAIMSSLLPWVRFPTMHRQYLVDQVEQTAHMMRWGVMKDLLLHAYKHHLFGGQTGRSGATADAQDVSGAVQETRGGRRTWEACSTVPRARVMMSEELAGDSE